MMKVERIIILFVLIVHTSITGFSQEVVASGGNYHSEGDVSISWTLGEFVIETVEAGDYILTQGFNQPDLGVTAIFEAKGLDISIDAYPNPTNNFVTVELGTEDYSQFQYQIVSQKGAILAHGKFNQKSTKVSFLNRAEGMYLLRILKDDKFVKTFKIYKK